MTRKHVCPECGEAMKLETRTVRVELEGLAQDVPAVRGWFCDACGEIEFADDAGAQAYAAAMDGLLKKNMKARALEIKNLRKRIKLTQIEAGKIFGGGVNAFSRYERGQTVPPKATLKLLRLLNRHPELLDEVRA